MRIPWALCKPRVTLLVLVTGLVAAYVAFQIPMKAWQHLAPLLFITGIVLLLLVLMGMYNQDYISFTLPPMLKQRIITAVAQIISNVIDRGMPIQVAMRSRGP